MLKAEQIPDEVFVAFQKAWNDTSTLSTKECLAAAINAWLGLSWMDSVTRHDILLPGFSKPVIILPLPQKEPVND